MFAFGYFLYVLFTLNGRIAEAFAKIDDIPKWLRLFPTACSLCLFVLLLDGYSSHDLYRSTWYMLAAMSACVSAMIPVPDSSVTPVQAPNLMKSRTAQASLSIVQ